MRLILISQDYQLYQTCRNVLEVAAPAGSEVAVCSPDQALEGDVCIWDYSDEVFTPRAFSRFAGTRALILSKKQISAFPVDVNEGTHLLLRPATEATLSAFIVPLDRGASAQSRVRALSSDRDALLGLLLQANLKLQEYDHARTNFLARAAHDCRAPLTAVSGYCNLLLQGEIGPLSPDQLDVLARMQSSINRLSRLSSAMFELSIDNRLEASFQMEVSRLEPSVQEAVRQITPMADEKRLRLAVHLEPSSEPLAFEPFRIEQVLINLLENSCKFTPTLGSVEIRGYDYFWDRRKPFAGPFVTVEDRRQSQVRRPNSYRIDVSDTGPGVPAEHAGDIFEEYTSYGGSQDRSCGGLGLAISKMIINHHGGQIWTANSSTGAVFSFVLPFHRVLAPAERPVS